VAEQALKYWQLQLERRRRQRCGIGVDLARGGAPVARIIAMLKAL